MGGSKLADGIARVLPPEDVTIVVNTGDDFVHLGPTTCPVSHPSDVYRLAGVASTMKPAGAGLAKSWHTITELATLGGADWFKLGDLDLASHLVRTQLLKEGETLCRP